MATRNENVTKIINWIKGVNSKFNNLNANEVAFDSKGTESALPTNPKTIQEAILALLDNYANYLQLDTDTHSIYVDEDENGNKIEVLDLIDEYGIVNGSITFDSVNSKLLIEISNEDNVNTIEITPTTLKINDVDIATVNDLENHNEDTNSHTDIRNTISQLKELVDKYLGDGSTIPTYEEINIAKSDNYNVASDTELPTTKAVKAIVDGAANNKVDKVNGKSLVSDSEIARLASVSNYDDTLIKKGVSNNSLAINKAKQTPIEIASASNLPSGNDKTYLTTDTGHWYYWNSESWTDGGVYQASKIADESITNSKVANSSFMDTSVLDNFIRDVSIYGLSQNKYVELSNIRNNYNGIYGFTLYYCDKESNIADISAQTIYNLSVSTKPISRYHSIKLNDLYIKFYFDWDSIDNYISNGTRITGTNKSYIFTKLKCNETLINQDMLDNDLNKKIGKVEQIDSQTSNKIGFKNYENTLNDVTLTIYDGNKIKLNGANTSNATFDFNITDYIDHSMNVGNSTDYISNRQCLSGTDANINCQMIMYLGTTQYVLCNFRGSTQNNVYSFINGSKGAGNHMDLRNGITKVVIRVLPNCVFNNMTNIVWINEGITTLDYENYYSIIIPNLKNNDPTIDLIKKESELYFNTFLKKAGHTPIITWIDDDTNGISNINKVVTICNNLNIKSTLGCITANLSSITGLKDYLLGLQEQGFHITTHTKTHGNWYKDMSDTDLMFTIPQCETDLIQSIVELKNNGFLDCDMLVYPGSSASRTGITEIVSKWCKCAIKPDGGANHLYGNGRYLMNREFILPTHDLQYYKDLIDEAYNNGDWLVFGTHSAIPNDWNTDLVTQVFQYAISKGIEIKTLNQAFKQRKYCYDLLDMQ